MILNNHICMGLYRRLRSYMDKRRIYIELLKSYPSLQIEEGLIIKGPLENLHLGSNVQIQSNVHIHLGGMDWCQNVGNLRIGDNAVISPFSLLYAAGPGGIVIGNNFDCGPGVKIFSSSSDYRVKNTKNFKKVKIGNNVILFANVVISPGVSIGDGAVVFPSSVVNEDIPQKTVYGGIPAKFIKGSY